jgi:hypothetical protein
MQSWADCITGTHESSFWKRQCFNLATRPLLTQHNRAAFIVAYDMERVLADIDADHGDCSIELPRHGVLLVFGAPCQLKTLAGQEHGRTIPLADIRTKLA